MKKLAFVLLAALAIAGIATTASADVVAAGFEADQLLTLQLLGYDAPAWMVSTGITLRPDLDPHGDFPLNCPDYNTSWCTYQYDGGCCCVGTPKVAGAFCQDYCV